MGTQTQNVSIAVPLRYLIQLARLDRVVTREVIVFSINVSAAYVWPLLSHVRQASQVLKMVFSSLSSALMSQYVDLNSRLPQYDRILNRDFSVSQFTRLQLRCAFCGQDSRHFLFFVYVLLIMLPLLLLSLHACPSSLYSPPSFQALCVLNKVNVDISTRQETVCWHVRYWTSLALHCALATLVTVGKTAL